MLAAINEGGDIILGLGQNSKSGIILHHERIIPPIYDAY